MYEAPCLIPEAVLFPLLNIHNFYHQPVINVNVELLYTCSVSLSFSPLLFYTHMHTLTNQHSVEVVDLVKRVLPVVSAAVQSITDSSKDPSVYSDTKLLHYATVETDHPYKPASISHFKVS